VGAVGAAADSAVWQRRARNGFRYNAVLFGTFFERLRQGRLRAMAGVFGGFVHDAAPLPSTGGAARFVGIARSAGAGLCWEVKEMDF
jgi:hypothetical protein